MSNTYQKYLLGVCVFLGLGLLWQAGARLGFFNIVLFPPPSRIWSGFVEIYEDGTWWKDVRYSGARYLTGYAIGNAVGIVLGFLTGRIQILNRLISPVLNYLRATPSVALVPAAIVWFGIGEMEKIFIVAWGCTFPVWINTFAGSREVETEYIWAAQTLGASGWKLYMEVYLPRALPYIVAGSRVSIATGFFALAAAEMAGAYEGIGFRIFHAHEFFRTDIMFSAILTIGLFALICDNLFVQIVRLALPWSKVETK